MEFVQENDWPCMVGATEMEKEARAMSTRLQWLQMQSIFELMLIGLSDAQLLLLDTVGKKSSTEKRSVDPRLPEIQRRRTLPRGILGIVCQVSRLARGAHALSWPATDRVALGRLYRAADSGRPSGLTVQQEAACPGATAAGIACRRRRRPGGARRSTMTGLPGARRGRTRSRKAEEAVTGAGAGAGQPR